MRCIAIDDEPLALKLLIQYCENIPSIDLLGTYTDSVEALSYIKSLKPDLIFLDIHMPDLSGIQIANVLDENTLLIFTTAYKEYAIDGFDLDAVDYLLKPFDFERFQKAYAKAEDRFNSNKKKTNSPDESKETCLAIKYNYQWIQIPIDDIFYIEAFDNYVKIITTDKILTPVMTLKNIIKYLPDDFIRVHKSYIVPMKKIQSYNRERIVIENASIPVGRSYCKDFIDRMNLSK